MRLFRYILVRKLLAIFFMAMLLFVQGLKLLHRHDAALSENSAVTGQHASLNKFIKTAHYCTICNYHLTKDAELPTAATPLQALPYLYITYIALPSAKHTGLLQAHTNKGPPAVL